MKKMTLVMMIIGLFITSPTTALFKSDTRKERVFSCTEMCTGIIKDQIFNGKKLNACDVLTLCKSPSNKCLESGSVLSRLKGRLSDVKTAIADAERRAVCAKAPTMIPSQQGVKRPMQPLPQQQPALQPARQSTQNRFAPPILNSDTVVILSIDGGGVRGVVPAVMVAELEKHLGGRKVSDVVDLFAGTSAGGILVTLLNVPVNPNAPVGQRRAKNTAAEALKLSNAVIGKIFDTAGLRKYRVMWGLTGSKYSTKPLIKIVQEEVGDNLRMYQLTKPTILVAVDLATHEPFYFNSYEKNNVLFAWEGVMASAAAPTFFKPYPLVMPDGSIMKLTDGGLVSNSPQQEAYLAAKQLYPNHSYFLISLSTGGSTLKADVAVQGKTAGSIPKMVGKTVETTLDAQTIKSTNFLKAMAKDPKQRLEYHRIEVTLPKECSSTDDASDENISCLLRQANAVVQRPDFMEMILRVKEVSGIE